MSVFKRYLTMMSYGLFKGQWRDVFSGNNSATSEI
jgi:hypothetical protein